MAKHGALGRGLSTLIPTMPTISQSVSVSRADDDRNEMNVDLLEHDMITLITPEKIVANPDQPRMDFTHQSLAELAESIKEHGILQPLTVTDNQNGTYTLIAGERRVRAAKMIGLSTVPVIVREVSEIQRFELAMIENIQRQDLNPIELAEGYKKLIDDFGLTQDGLAKKMGKSRSVIANHIRLLSLPVEIQHSLAVGEITEYQARNLLGVANLKDQQGLWIKMKKGEMTGDEARLHAQKTKVNTHDRTISKDMNTQAQESALEETLGTRVRIRKRSGKGQVVIEFYSEEELGAIVSKIVR